MGFEVGDDAFLKGLVAYHFCKTVGATLVVHRHDYSVDTRTDLAGGSGVVGHHNWFAEHLRLTHGYAFALVA